jgi:hypothetical protein
MRLQQPADQQAQAGGHGHPRKVEPEAGLGELAGQAACSRHMSRATRTIPMAACEPWQHMQPGRRGLVSRAPGLDPCLGKFRAVVLGEQLGRRQAGRQLPDSRKSSVAPRPYRSVAGWHTPENCSGAMNPNVPTAVLPNCQLMPYPAGDTRSNDGIEIIVVHLPGHVDSTSPLRVLCRCKLRTPRPAACCPDWQHPSIMLTYPLSALGCMGARWVHLDNVASSRHMQHPPARRQSQPARPCPQCTHPRLPHCQALCPCMRRGEVCASWDSMPTACPFRARSAYTAD